MFLCQFCSGGNDLLVWIKIPIPEDYISQQTEAGAKGLQKENEEKFEHQGTSSVHSR